MAGSLRWGLLATGRIAGKFAEGVLGSQTGKLVAVGSRTQEAAERFGATFSVLRRHGSYEALLADPEVDAIYISTPNHLHAEWTIKAAQAGKHVLCEKPFASNYAEAARALEAVKAAGVFFMEAFMYRCHPQTAKLKELLEAGTIGELRAVQASFSFDMGTRTEDIRLHNEMAGGGIMDVGCYTMSLVRLLCGEPVEIKGSANIGAASRVDEGASASVKFANGCVGTLLCGITFESDTSLNVWGSSGSIRVPNPWKPDRTGNQIIIQRKDQPSERISIEAEHEIYTIEADTVATYREARQAPPPCMTWDDTLHNMKALDEWRKSAGLVWDMEQSK